MLFLGRHGQGEHNVAEAKYGTPAWDCYWSYLDGADGLVWSDAHLTRVGEQQALDVHALWKAQLALGMPPPDRYVVSPLTRTVQTADLSFRELELPEGKQYEPFVKELLREALGGLPVRLPDEGEALLLAVLCLLSALALYLAMIVTSTGPNGWSRTAVRAWSIPPACLAS